MMLLKLNEPIKGFDGSVIQEGLTLRKVCVDSLTMTVTGDEKLAGEKKFEMGMLAQKLATAAEDVELKAEEVVELKHRTGLVYSPAIVFYVWQRLEGKCSYSL